MPSFDSRIISDYVVVDLETTGLSPENDKIIEIAAVKVINDTVTDTFSTLVDPHRHINSYITEITGKTTSGITRKPFEFTTIPLYLYL